VPLCSCGRFSCDLNSPRPRISSNKRGRHGSPRTYRTAAHSKRSRQRGDALAKTRRQPTTREPAEYPRRLTRSRRSPQVVGSDCQSSSRPNNTRSHSRDLARCGRSTPGVCLRMSRRIVDTSRIAVIVVGTCSNEAREGLPRGFGFHRAMVPHFLTPVRNAPNMSPARTWRSSCGGRRSSSPSECAMPLVGQFAASPMAHPIPRGATGGIRSRAPPTTTTSVRRQPTTV
jgi:hypothetical protein